MNYQTIQDFLSRWNRLEFQGQTKIEKAAAEYQVPLLDQISGQFLRLLSALKKPSRILEIGFGAGYSTLWMASGFPEAEIFSLEKDPERFSRGMELLKNFSEYKITLLHEDARIYLKNSFQPFDLVFFDGVKSQYLEYLNLVRPWLSPGALVISDNLFYRGKVFEENLSPRRKKELEKSAAFNEALASAPDFDAVFLAVGDGMALGIYRGIQ